MSSTPAAKETSPRVSSAIKPEAAAAARTDKAPAKPAPEARRPSAPQGQKISDVLAGASAPSASTMFRAATADNSINAPSEPPASGKPAGRKWARRASISFLFALFSVIAAAGWARYGDAAKAIVVSLAPNHPLRASPPQEQPAVAEQPGSPVLQTATADQTATQPEPLAPSEPSAGPAAAVLAPESAQLLQSMSQQIEQLRASIDELKSGQQQISRDVSETRSALAGTSEQNLRPVIPARPLRPGPAPARTPGPAFAAGQAAAAVAPPQPRPARTASRREGEPVLRPPMPLRPGASAFP